MKKPVNPHTHGIIDYIFSAIQLAGPTLLKLNDNTKKTYSMLGSGFLATNMLSDTPVGVERIIPFKVHQKIDAAFLGTLSLLTFSRKIKNDKVALAFHLGLLATAVAHYVLTDYDEESNITNKQQL
jgi:hypothetical protein